MTPEQAAQEFWELVDDVEAAKPMMTRFDRACDRLKKHMREKNVTTFRGIKLESFSRGRRLSLDLLTEKVGADVVEACKEETVGYRLLRWRRPKATQPAA